MSNNHQVVYAKESPFILIINQVNDESTRVLNLIAANHDRILIYRERNLLLRFAIKFLLREDDETKNIGIRKLAILLDHFFDFRHLNNPNKTLGTQSLETEIYELKKKMKGKE